VRVGRAGPGPQVQGMLGGVRPEAQRSTLSRFSTASVAVFQLIDNCSKCDKNSTATLFSASSPN